MKELLKTKWFSLFLPISIFAITLFLLSFQEITSNDFWWNLAIGKWMIANQSFLAHDIFSYTFASQLWFNHVWLFDLIMFLIYSSTSYWGLNILRFIIYAFTFFFLYKAIKVKKLGPPIFITILFLLTLPAMRPFMRPEILFPLFVMLFLWILTSYKYHRSRLIYALPLTMVLWVNSHGSFIIGFVLIGIFFVSELVRTLLQHSDNPIKWLKRNKLLIGYLSVGLLSLVAMLINPHGPFVIERLLNYFSGQEAHLFIAEWFAQPISSLVNIVINSKLSVMAVLIWTALLTLSLKAMRLKKNAKRFFACFFYEDIILFAFFAYLAIKHVRFSFVLALMAVYLIGKNLPQLISLKRYQVLLSMIFLATLVFLGYTMQTNFQLSFGPKPFRYPEETIDFLKNHNIQGTLLNDYDNGGLIISQLYPQFQVFIDGRTPNLYSNDFFWYYRHLNEEKVFDSISDIYQFDVALLTNNSSLIPKLLESDDWALVFFDNSSSVLLKHDDQPMQVIEENQYSLLHPYKPKDDYLQYCDQSAERANLDEEIDRNIDELAKPLYSLALKTNMVLACPEANRDDHIKAAQYMKQAIQYNPDNHDFHYQLGLIYNELDQYNNAIASLKRSVGLNKNRTNMTGLGIAYYNKGQYWKAEQIFKKIVRLPGEMPAEYYQTYGRVLYQLDKNERAIEQLKRYQLLVDDKDIIAQDFIDLASAYKDAGNSTQADLYFKKATEYNLEIDDNDEGNKN